MALQFENTGSGGGGTTISGTPYYIAMFNAAGDNVGDTNIYRNIGADVDIIEFRSPNRLNTPWNITSGNTLSNSSFNGAFQFGTVLIDSGSATFGTRFKLDSGTGGSITLETSAATNIPTIALFDHINSNTALIKNDNGLKFVVNDGSSIIFNNDSDNARIVINYDASGIVQSWHSATTSSKIQAQIIEAIDAPLFYLISNSGDSTFSVLVSDSIGDSLLIFREGGDQLFKVTYEGLETSSGNTWQFNGVLGAAPTPDSSLLVVVNGTTYKIAAEAV